MILCDNQYDVISNNLNNKIFFKAFFFPFIYLEKPKTVWTSGTRCPKASSSGTKLITRWVSSEEPFQSWLEEKTSSSSHSGSIFAKRCEYLAVSPAARLPDVKYDFKVKPFSSCFLSKERHLHISIVWK